MAADQLKLPFIYVRPKPKEHGLGNQIEGDFQSGQKVLVIEDLVSTGKSSLQAVDALQNKGLTVVGMVSIFNYGFPIASEQFADRGINYTSLTDYPTLIALAASTGLIDQEQLLLLEKWRENPSTWTL